MVKMRLHITDKYNWALYTVLDYYKVNPADVVTYKLNYTNMALINLEILYKTVTSYVLQGETAVNTLRRLYPYLIPFIEIQFQFELGGGRGDINTDKCTGYLLYINRVIKKVQS